MKELENKWMKKWESVKEKPSALLTSILRDIQKISKQLFDSLIDIL